MPADPCTFTAQSGHKSGSACGKTARFTVVSEAPGETEQRVCGRHIGLAVERHSRPGARAVIVIPDFYDSTRE